METIDYRSKEQKREDRKRKLKEKWNSFVIWCEEHFLFFVTVFSAILGFFVSLSKTKKSNEKACEEKKLKERMIYDRRNGHYVEVKRQPRGSEWMEIDERYEQGESMAEIADDMGLLKK